MQKSLTDSLPMDRNLVLSRMDELNKSQLASFTW